jgi:hypothetical protein
MRRPTEDILNMPGIQFNHAWIDVVEVRPGVKAADYSMPGHRRWGHDFSITKIREDGTLDAYGFAIGLEPGDLIVFGHSTQGNKLYRFIEVSYEADPRDMWRGHAEWVEDLDDWVHP